MWTSAAFLRGYLGASKTRQWCRRRPAQQRALLDLFLLDKALYELQLRVEQPAGLGPHPTRGIEELLDPMTDRAVHAPTERSRSRVWHPSFGAIPIDNGVRFRVWATPARRQLTLLLRRGDGLQRLAPVRGADGIWELFVPDVPAGRNTPT